MMPMTIWALAIALLFVNASWVEAKLTIINQLSATPASLQFGKQLIDTSSSAQSVVIRNDFPGDVVNLSIGSLPAGYSVVGNTCSTLATGAVCSVALVFSPLIGGVSGGFLSVNYRPDGSIDTGALFVPVSGEGMPSLVTHFYQSILRRTPDADGKAFWNAEAARVQLLGLNVNEVWYSMAQTFYTSAEYVAFGRDNTGFVTDLYTTFFSRAPDKAGMDYWKGQLDAGLPREVALSAFMFSIEFTSFSQAIFGNMEVRAEIDAVTDFYRGLLSRLPDDGGFAYWLARFRGAQCSGGNAVNAEVEWISSLFANSPEYGNRTRNDSQYVGDLYNAFLRRGGDLGGVQFWIDEIVQGRRSRENVRRAFVASPEFQARVAATINAGCISQPSDFDIDGNMIPTTPTGGAGATICTLGTTVGPGPGPCGAYKISVGNCSDGMSGVNAITDAYLWQLEDMQPGSLRLGNTMRHPLARSAAMVWKFRTGPTGAFPFDGYPLQVAWSELSSRGATASPFISISTKRCDFDYAKLATGIFNSCYQSGDTSGGMLGKVYAADQNPAAIYPYCPLKAETTYYLNIRWESARAAPGEISCPPDAPQCAMTLGFN